MRRDRKAESIQAATGSSHGYEMLSSESVCVHPSSGNKQVLKLHSLEESFSFQRDMRKCRMFPCLLCRNESSRVYKVRVLCLRAVTENTVKSMCQLLLLLLLVVPLIFPKDKFNLRFLGPCLVQLC